MDLRETAAPGAKLLGLELLRFIAAMAVLVWHYQHFAFHGTAIDVLRDQQPFYRWLMPAYEYGWYGVQVFWTISGFIFFWRYRDNVAAGAVGGWRFFVLRFSRLYPLHLFTLLLVASLQVVYTSRFGHGFVYQFNDARHFLLQLFLASHWGLQAGYSFNGPIWSISVEVLVYLVFYVILSQVGKSPWLNVAALLACVALKIAGLATPVSDCIGLFYGGGLAAVLFVHCPGALLRRAVRGVAIGAPVVAWLLVSKPSDLFLYYFLLAYLPVLLFCLAYPWPLGPRAARTVAAAGNMTYASYLLHFPLQLMIALYFGAHAQPIPIYSASLFLFFIGATWVAAWLTYRFLELPAQLWLRRTLGGQAAPARLSS